jgi:hypothetical protein
MSTLPLTDLSSPSDPQQVSLWIPPVAGAATAVVIVGISAILAFHASGDKEKGSGHWLRSSVEAGHAWSPSDSWATNTAGVGGILGAVVTAAGAGLGSILTSNAIGAITVLFLIFSGAAALAPITYGALATSPSPDTTIETTKASVLGFLAAAIVTMTALMGVLATVALLVWQFSNSTAGKIILVAFLIIGAILAALYALKTIKLFAGAQPAAPQPAAAQPRVLPNQSALSSMLGNARSGTM